MKCTYPISLIKILLAILPLVPLEVDVRNEDEAVEVEAGACLLPT